MPMTITRNNSFRFEDNKTRPICVVSSVSKNQHIITTNIKDGKPSHLDSDFQNDISQAIYRNSPEHNNELHYNDDPDSDTHHSHLKYKNPYIMLKSLLKAFPEEAKEIIDKLTSHRAATS